MSLKASFELMADYNRWMNANLCRAAAALAPGELLEDRGAYFNSILGTLNHLLIGDTIWLQRIAGRMPALSTLRAVGEMPAPEKLDALLYSELETFARAREALDEVIVGFVGELTEEMLASPLGYRNMKGEVRRKNLGHLLLHFFNHQTHHRGQVTTLFSQAGVDVGITDLLVKIPDCH